MHLSCDGGLAPLVWLIQVLCGKPVYCIVHGLDVSFPGRLYQALVVRWSLPRLKRLIAVGNATLEH